jgi:hypothetical protein
LIVPHLAPKRLSRDPPSEIRPSTINPLLVSFQLLLLLPWQTCILRVLPCLPCPCLSHLHPVVEATSPCASALSLSTSLLPPASLWREYTLFQLCSTTYCCRDTVTSSASASVCAILIRTSRQSTPSPYSGFKYIRRKSHPTIHLHVQTRSCVRHCVHLHEQSAFNCLLISPTLSWETHSRKSDDLEEVHWWTQLRTAMQQ